MRVVGTRDTPHGNHVFRSAATATMTPHDRDDSDESDQHSTSPADVSPGESGAETEGETPLVFEFRVPATAVALGQTLPKFPETIVELEQLVPTQHDPMPFLWATGGDLSEFEAAAAADPTVDRIRRHATFTEGALYRVRWMTDENLLHRFINGDETVLQAEGNGDEWIAKIRTASRGQLSSFRDFCDEQGINFEVIRLYDLSEPKMGQFNISEKQRTALVKALDMGYFNIPRDATLDDLAAELGISKRAVSERLRRGQTNLVSDTLTIGNPTGIGIEEL